MLTAEKSYNFLPRRQRHKATAKNKNAKSVTQKVDSVKEAVTEEKERNTGRWRGMSVKLEEGRTGIVERGRKHSPQDVGALLQF